MKTPRARTRPLLPPVTRVRTRRGWRLLQHGTVLSEVLLSPGPTHSVFDVLAALARLHPAPAHLALLGFGGGGAVAALRALGLTSQVHGVDLDPRGHRLLRAARTDWLQPARCHFGDAVAWLARSRRRFDLVIDDLSIPTGSDVAKPEATWRGLPTLVARRLAPGGVAVFNLLRPPALGWTRGLAAIRPAFRHHAIIHLARFHNRILVASQCPDRINRGSLGPLLRAALRQLGSRLAPQIRIEFPRPDRHPAPSPP